MEKKKLTRTKSLATVEEQERAVELLNQKAEAAEKAALPVAAFAPAETAVKSAPKSAAQKPAPPPKTVAALRPLAKKQVEPAPEPDEKTLYSYNVKLDADTERRVKTHIARTGKNMKGFFQIAIREFLDGQGD